jgi:hypothetical protein
MNGQPKFTYDPASIETLIKYISLDRLAAYFAMGKTVPERAIHLHERNTELSEAMYGVLQGFEITLRNAVHNSLSAAHGDEWYEKVSLLESEYNSLHEAKHNIEQRIESITPGRVVAELGAAVLCRVMTGHCGDRHFGGFFR